MMNYLHSERDALSANLLSRCFKVKPVSIIQAGIFLANTSQPRYGRFGLRNSCCTFHLVYLFLSLAKRPLNRIPFTFPTPCSDEKMTCFRMPDLPLKFGHVFLKHPVSINSAAYDNLLQ
ncbi:hypothetical protein AVEN_121251-1 [Araneus ventricosus]|uniref:Uncharacterized protein n=1 Tax=Araneus ventricosus TaxID=182803 RepID=A0A4Y2L0V5_ARAVE|nr:hypothetical protein AVEN_121251-1 [Araneus ventricosus]